MKKLLAIMMLLLVAASASAISQGPGGRLYMTERVVDPGDGTYYISLKSYQIDADWTIVGGEAPTDHGYILDNCNGATLATTNVDRNKPGAGISPEIVTGAGDGFGATMVMGAHYNNDPISTAYPDYEVMDIIKVTTTDGSHSVELLGTGRQSNYDGAWHNADFYRPHTDRGTLAIPDREGGFMGEGEYFVRAYGKFDYRMIVTDTESDGDCTDDDADYIAVNTRYQAPTWGDHEFLNDRLYMASNYCQYAEYNGTWGHPPDLDPLADPGTTFASSPAILYYENNGDGTLTNQQLFLWKDPSRTDFSPVGLLPQCTSMVATVIDGHDAVYTRTQTQIGYWGGAGDPLNASSEMKFMLAIDLNDDGDAMDVGEQRIIFTDDDAAEKWNDVDYGVSFGDMELVEHDGKKFLLINNTAGGYNLGSHTTWVMELADNGDYIGTGDAGVHLILSEDDWIAENFLGAGATSEYEQMGEIEFDANMAAEQIPGDANGDLKVDGGDLQQWQINYDPLGLNVNTWAMGDWDGDGDIDGGDLQLWQINYDPLGPPAGAVPEPATMLLLGTGVLGALGYVRRRKLS